MRAGLCGAHLCLCGGRSDGLVIVDVERPSSRASTQKCDAGGQLNDAEDVIVGSTNASLFAYVADGRNGLKVLQLTAPTASRSSTASRREPKPELIAWARHAVAGAGPVQGPRPRPCGRRDRRPDRGLRTHRLAAVHPAGDGALLHRPLGPALPGDGRRRHGDLDGPAHGGAGRPVGFWPTGRARHRGGSAVRGHHGRHRHRWFAQLPVIPAAA